MNAGTRISDDEDGSGAELAQAAEWASVVPRAGGGVDEDGDGVGEDGDGDGDGVIWVATCSICLGVLWSVDAAAPKCPCCAGTGVLTGGYVGGFANPPQWSPPAEWDYDNVQGTGYEACVRRGDAYEAAMASERKAAMQREEEQVKAMMDEIAQHPIDEAARAQLPNWQRQLTPEMEAILRISSLEAEARAIAAGLLPPNWRNK